MMQYHVPVSQNHRAADEHDKRTHRALWPMTSIKAIEDVSEVPAYSEPTRAIVPTKHRCGG
jgi:hypothetical protein